MAIPFKISSRSQEFPIVEISDGQRFIKLDDSNSLIAKTIGKFKESRGFEPRDAAVIISVGGNWNYAVEFARTFPETRLLLVEAMPGVFSTAIDISMFMQYFRADTVIIGVDPALADWEALLLERLAEFKSAGLRIFSFVPPHIAKIPLLEENSDTIRRAVRNGT